MLDSEEDEEGGEEGEGLKSQRPRRRKQAVQVARPAMWPCSACQPKRERARAEGLILLGVVSVGEEGVGVEVGGVDGMGERGSGDGGWKRGDSFCDVEERSKASGV